MAKPLGKYSISIDEDTYKVDLAVVDRYQAFSAELLRLSLLGITGYGFLLSQIVFKGSESVLFLHSLSNYRWLLGLGVLVLGLSSAFALGHRYFSTDCITHYVRLLRLQKQYSELGENDPQVVRLEEAIDYESKSLRRDLKRCKWLLVFSSILLFLGVIAITVTFSVILFPSALSTNSPLLHLSSSQIRYAPK